MAAGWVSVSLTFLSEPITKTDHDDRAYALAVRLIEMLRPGRSATVCPCLVEGVFARCSRWLAGAAHHPEPVGVAEEVHVLGEDTLPAVGLSGMFSGVMSRLSSKTAMSAPLVCGMEVSVTSTGPAEWMAS